MAETFTKVVAPTLGLVLSNAMFAAPLAQVDAARKAGALGALNPLPFVAIFSNCVLWLVYGCYKRDGFIFFSNSQGVVLGVWLTLSCLPLADAKQRRTLERAFCTVTALLVTVAFIVGIALGGQPPGVGEQVVGRTAMVAAVAFYLVPLSTLRDVIKNRDASSLSMPLCCASLANAALWTIYGVAVEDSSITAPNIPGILAGCLQLFLLTRYGRGASQSQGAVGGGGSGGAAGAVDGPHSPMIVGDLNGDGGASSGGGTGSSGLSTSDYDALEAGGRLPLLAPAGPHGGGGNWARPSLGQTGQGRTLSPRRISGAVSRES